MASPAFGAIGTLTNVNNTTSVTRPAVSAGDAMLWPVVLAYGDASVATPSGWTLIASIDQNSAFEPAQYLFGKVAGASEPASYSVTISGQGGGNNFGYGVILTYTGALSSGTFEASATLRNTTASSSVNVPGVTALSANTTQVAIYIPVDSSSTSLSWTPPSGMTERLDQGQTPTGSVLGISDIAVASAGAIAARTATLSASQKTNVLTVLIASEAAAGPTTATLTGPTTGTTGSASSNFTVTLDVAATSTVTITPAGTVGTVTFSPSSPTITAGNTSTTFTANADTDGTHSISITTSPTLTYSGSPISYVSSTSSGGDTSSVVTSNRTGRRNFGGNKR